MLQLLIPRDPNNPDKPLNPLDHQREFSFSKAMNTFLAGGWGSAKTTGGLWWIAVSMACNPGLPGIIAQPTYMLLKEFVQTDFEPAFRPYISKIIAGGRLIIMKDGTRIIGLSYDRLDLFEKHTVAWGYADEAALGKPLLFTKLTARVRHPNARRLRIGYSGTPHYGWMKDAFEGRDDQDRRIIHAKTTDNIHATKKFLTNLYQNCPARMRRAYIDGQFVAPGGTVYPEFDPETHVIDWEVNTDWPIVPAIDWSARTPAVVFVQLVPEHGHVNGIPMRLLEPAHKWAAAIVFDEMVPDGSVVAYSTPRLCDDILDRRYPLTEFIADPAGKNAQDTSGLDNIRIAKKALGVPWRKRMDAAARLVVNGVDHIKNLLEPHDGIPRLYFARDMCERAQTLALHLKARASINAFAGYSYPAEKDGALVSIPVKDNITDHFNDALRYAIVYYFPAARLLMRVRNTA